jgi:cell division protein FtsL
MDLSKVEKVFVVTALILSALLIVISILGMMEARDRIQSEYSTDCELVSELCEEPQ